MNVSTSSALKITPSLWFDSDAEDAAALYVSVFPNSRITLVSRHTEAGFEHHGKPAGSVLALNFELCGQPFMAINGGPVFKLSEAMSLSVSCDTQEEIDYYWEKLGAGGDAACQNCGWLKDRFGLSWQIVPGILAALVSDPSTSASVMQAVLSMTKLDLQRIQEAAKSATH